MNIDQLETELRAAMVEAQRRGLRITRGNNSREAVCAVGAWMHIHPECNPWDIIHDHCDRVEFYHGFDGLPGEGHYWELGHKLAREFVDGVSEK